jgi:hypothetical protein
MKQNLSVSELKKYGGIRIDAFIAKIENEKPFEISTNMIIDTVILPKNKNLQALQALKDGRHDFDKLKVFSGRYNNQEKMLFTDSNDTQYRMTKFFKSEYFGGGSTKNKNSTGKKLTDAGERATIKALELYVKGVVLTKPEQTEEPLFINDLESFVNWENTFIKTPKLVTDLLQGIPLSDFYIEHDGTENRFSSIIKTIVSYSGIKKDSWNPADVWLIKKSEFDNIIKQFNNIFESKFEKKEKLKFCNDLIIDLFNKKQLYPISLKQITDETGSIEYSNLNSGDIKFYEYNIKKVPFDFSTNKNNTTFNSKEIGLFLFTNKDIGKDVQMQIRTFPHKFATVQTEITSDGTKTGGRLGKVPTGVIDRILGDHNFSRITKISQLKNLELTNKQISDFTEYYEFVSGGDKYFRNNIDIWINIAQQDEEFKTRLSNKLQGLLFSYFFLKNKDSINDIINRYILGAKKISPNGGFFIKIY